MRMRGQKIVRRAGPIQRETFCRDRRGEYTVTMPSPEARDVHQRARDAALASDRPLLLAVSGGLDSMSLLDAMSSAAPGRIAAVATFDHASGAHSARAAAFVRAEAKRRGLRVVSGRMPSDADRSNGLEAMWRTARQQFLLQAAAS